MNDDMRLLATWPKGDGEVRLTLRAWQGNLSIDLRMYFEPEPGRWLPTKKGAGLSAEFLPELIDALNNALALVEGAAV